MQPLQCGGEKGGTSQCSHFSAGNKLVEEENRLHRPGDEEDFEAIGGGFRANQGHGASAGGMSKSKEIELNSRCKILKD